VSRKQLVTALVVAVMLMPGTLGAATRPSERACLLAWNAPSNAANHSRLARDWPWAKSTLRPGIAFTVVFKRGSRPKQTTTEACLLTLAKGHRIQPVSGIWRRGGVARWVFAHPHTANRPLGANVKVLRDGRVTKIYRR
jgi:hypothetical protein